MGCGVGDRPGLAIVAVECEGAQSGRGEGDGIPFEDDGGLGCVADAEDRTGGGVDAVEGVDFFL